MFRKMQFGAIQAILVILLFFNIREFSIVKKNGLIFPIHGILFVVLVYCLKKNRFGLFYHGGVIKSPLAIICGISHIPIKLEPVY